MLFLLLESPKVASGDAEPWLWVQSPTEEILKMSDLYDFPTCQVRVVRFYVRSCPPPFLSSFLPSLWLLRFFLVLSGMESLKGFVVSC